MPIPLPVRTPRRLTAASPCRGARELAEVDPDLGDVLARLGEPPMWGRVPGFPALIQIILEQQVSLAAARTMYRRLTGYLGAMTPEAVYAIQVNGLRDVGLTRQKAGYCFGLAARILDGSLDLSSVANGPDDRGRQILLAVPGLGAWSVDIYYLMALRRPDVWPQGDLALSVALREVKRLTDLPTKNEQQLLASHWVPWRSVAARILWAHYLAARGQYLPDNNGMRMLG
ncbi:MAG: DNA-3-methyladenine glycosylase 2 family protein [Nitrospirales bacterium]|nr:DNA-3-methyladenine glycosylase 2 family protein [Nitrospirales bacterium]